MTVKLKILIFFLTISLSVAFGQVKEDKIIDIRKKFQIINQDSSYKTKNLINEQFLEQMTDGGGELTGYLKDGKICKIIERIGISYCVRTFEYYFWDRQLIFVYEQELDPLFNNSTATFDWTRTSLAFEGHYYFDKGKLIETVMTGKKRIADDLDIDKEKKFTTEANRICNLLKE